MTDDRKVCPREPTEAMVLAGIMARTPRRRGLRLGEVIANDWRAMYDAAPALAAEPYVEIVDLTTPPAAEPQQDVAQIIRDLENAIPFRPPPDPGAHSWQAYGEFCGRHLSRLITAARAAAAALESLARERDTWQRCSEGLRTMLQQAESDLAAARERIAELEQDAERYRWLRIHCESMSIDPPLTVARVMGWGLDAWSGDNLDAAVDAARAGKNLP